jgi:hypothetical protein
MEESQTATDRESGRQDASLSRYNLKGDERFLGLFFFFFPLALLRLLLFSTSVRPATNALQSSVASLLISSSVSLFLPRPVPLILPLTL